MKDQLPDWLQPHDTAAPSQDDTKARHLKVLRTLLAQDYLRRPDWDFALKDLARMAHFAFNAQRTLVATLQSDGQWSAVTDDGQQLQPQQISQHASTTVLKHITDQHTPIITSQTPLPFHSQSMAQHAIDSVMAIPLFWWDVAASNPTPKLGGCIYAHRTHAQEPFAQHDIELATDIARVAQPILNLLSHLRSVETTLAHHKRALLDLSTPTGQRLGTLETHDPHFTNTVVAPLKQIAHANKINIIIQGPTGAGKTHLARAYHLECPRRDHPFITLDCSQIVSETTLAAELFGYAPHSGYANAPPQGRLGKASLAHQGTLFIDEVGCLPADIQQQLLRLVQEGRFSPLGASTEQHVDLQIIAATNIDLATMVKEGRFREDLYWRLQEFVVHIPPLNQRQADIPTLAHRFLKQALVRFDRHNIQGLSPQANTHLQTIDWSQHGNIRGLEHAIRRAVLLAPPNTTVLTPQNFASHTSTQAPPTPQPPTRLRMKDFPTQELKRALQNALERCQYNINAVARDPQLRQYLGRTDTPLSPSTIKLWLGELGIKDELPSKRSQNQDLQLQTIIQAIQQNGSGTAAAKHLGISRNKLVWTLRKEGMTIGQILNTPS